MVVVKQGPIVIEGQLFLDRWDAARGLGCPVGAELS
jgi:hypothetical protein